MSLSNFLVREHALPCQHIREYPRATVQSQEDVLHLAIKQYIPLSNQQPKYGDVTIIAAHANGFPKELYEPLWDELLKQSKLSGFGIRGIWIADISNQGQAVYLMKTCWAMIATSWLDHSRDLLLMVNYFRAEMPMPIAGIGHSLGGAQLVNLALIHPRLFTTLVLLDPVIQRHASAPGGPGPARASSFRRDIWHSREEAVASFTNSKFYKSWDKRVLAAWIKHGLRSTPTKLYSAEAGEVTLSTTKHQEVFTFLRPNFNPQTPDGQSIVDRAEVPDLDESTPYKNPFYRPEPPAILARLDQLRPSTFYVFGEESEMSSKEAQQEKLEITGRGIGGSGGIHEGRVSSVNLKGIGHLVAMEAVNQCADVASSWLGNELQRWKKQQQAYAEWLSKNQDEKTTISEEYKTRIGGPLKRGLKEKVVGYGAQK